MKYLLLGLLAGFAVFGLTCWWAEVTTRELKEWFDDMMKGL